MSISKFTYLLSFLSVFTLLSQEVTEISEPEYIKTVQFRQNNTNLSGIPLIAFNDSFEFSFDDIIGDEAFYYYKISYYNFDWTPTILAKNEYLDGLDNIRINDTENSFNVLKIFTHYKVRFPNQNTRRLKKTGNYILSVFNNDDELVFSKKFIVYSTNSTVQAKVKRSRNFKYINTKQVVQFEISPTQLIIAPQKNLKVMLLQNGNPNTAITNLKPQYNIGNKYIYRYDQEASFWAGNEYWNFDNKDVRSATVNIKYIELQEIYHNYLYGHGSRTKRPYTFYPDINGNYVVRNLDATNSDIEAEYVWLHFTAIIPELKNNKELHIYGGFNNFKTDETTLLTYDKKSQQYKGKRLFKQGFYNFKYVTKDSKGLIDENEICGNFDKTENEYSILVYYRAPGARNDSVIGFGNTNSSIITN